MIRSSDDACGNPLGGLTDKQREVLDLLIQHKTSKEISRLLGISPHTVDQSIMLARAKLHVGSRGDVAQAYRHLLGEAGVAPPRAGHPSDIYQRPVYQFPDLAAAPDSRHTDPREAADGTLFPDQVGSFDAALPAIGVLPDPAVGGHYHVLPEVLDGPGGTLLRLGVIALITVFLTLVIVGGLTMYVQLSHMLVG